VTCLRAKGWKERKKGDRYHQQKAALTVPLRERLKSGNGHKVVVVAPKEPAEREKHLTGLREDKMRVPRWNVVSHPNSIASYQRGQGGGGTALKITRCCRGSKIYGRRRVTGDSQVPTKPDDCSGIQKGLGRRAERHWTLKDASGKEIRKCASPAEETSSTQGKITRKGPISRGRWLSTGSLPVPAGITREEMPL